MADGEAALLTAGQREYLRGEKEFSRSAHERQMKNRLRERLRRGITDFTMLGEGLPADLQCEVFEGVRTSSLAEHNEQTFSGERGALDGEVKPGHPGGYLDPDVEDPFTRTNSRLEDGMIDAIAFFYVAAEDAGLDPENLIERGVWRGEERRTDDRWMINDVSLEVDKDVQHTLAKRALQNIAAGEDLTNAELRALLESGRGNITPEQIQGYVAGEWEPDDSDVLDPASGV